MKKIIFSILILVLLSMLCALPAFAASATANVGSISGNRDATVTVSVSLASGVTVGSGGIELTYDKNVLELVKGEWNVSGTSLATFNTTNNKGAFAYASATAISGKVFTATFKIKSNAAFADSVVKMTLQLKDGANADISVTNNSGKVTVTCKHSYSAWSNANGTSHTRKCSVCQTIETKKHSFTNACDTSCNDCSYTRTTTHNYKTAWSSNDSQHWHECSVCKEKKDAESHTPGEAATETTPQVCTVCQHILAEAAGHTHSYDSTWNSDENNHWQICTSCNQSSATEAHQYDGNCDKSCNTCGYERTVSHSYRDELGADDSAHWQVCDICGEPSEKSAHKYDNRCDATCDDCGNTRTVEHTYDNGKITKEPTADSIGEKTYTCTSCGDTKVSELEYYISQSNSGAEQGIATWWLYAVGASALVIGFIIGILVKSAGKKK